MIPDVMENQFDEVLARLVGDFGLTLVYSESADLVIVAGMGGSALGTHVIQTIYKDELKVPVIISNDYLVIDRLFRRDTIDIFPKYL